MYTPLNSAWRKAKVGFRLLRVPFRRSGAQITPIAQWSRLEAAEPLLRGPEASMGSGRGGRRRGTLTPLMPIVRPTNYSS